MAATNGVDKIRLTIGIGSFATLLGILIAAFQSYNLMSNGLTKAETLITTIREDIGGIKYEVRKLNVEINQIGGKILVIEAETRRQSETLKAISDRQK